MASQEEKKPSVTVKHTKTLSKYHKASKHKNREARSTVTCLLFTTTSATIFRREQFRINVPQPHSITHLGLLSRYKAERQALASKG